MAPTSRPSYFPISTMGSASSSDIDEGEETAFLTDKTPSVNRRSRIYDTKFLLASGLNIIFFIISCTLAGTWYYNTHIQLNAALRRASTYSPIHDLVDLKMGVKKVNGTLFPPKEGSSIARHGPNPKDDAIWEEYELTRYFIATAAQIRAMGKDPSTAAKLDDEEWGLGDDAYVTILDVYHQLHCLNTLRQLAYPGYYENATSPDSSSHQHPHSHPRHAKRSEMFEIHINHCVDILMQAIQCSGNVNLITMHWVESQLYPFPDMSVNRQCIDFDGLTEWRRENSIDMDKYVETMRKKEGQVTELRAPDEYYRLYLPGVVNPNHVDGTNPGEDFNL